jgi:glycosyltransferase XagB
MCVVSNVVYQPLEGRETDDLSEELSCGSAPLPVLPKSLLPGLFARLSQRDQEIALRHKLVPVACIPNLTLYGAVGETARIAAEQRGIGVVAQISPSDFRATLRGSMGVKLLNHALNNLKHKQPHFSAHQRLTMNQIAVALAAAAGCLAGICFLSREIIYLFASLFFGLFFLSIISLRLLAIMGEGEARREMGFQLSDDELPDYSVLVPVFRETRVLDQLISALTELDYPPEKLDIKIILEETDVNMLRAISVRMLPNHFEIIVVPSGKPQTKPRALNYALQFARGTLLAIFDAEDIPEPLQLRKAAERFAAAPRELACLQAELAFYNPNENWLTRQFTVEYATLFKMVLPSLAHEGLPLLLGGTSNHFRTAILRHVGGWDPYNVTEDADLGLRLARMGYQTSVLDSVTYEEANTHLANWLQQRARWLKGFLQTWLVHMRNPVTTLEELGGGGFWVMNAMTLGIVVSGLFHPFFIGHAIYALLSGEFSRPLQGSFVTMVAAINLVVLFCGYSFSIYTGYRALRRKNITGWWRILLSMPIYWLLMTVSAWMAVWQLMVNPFHWNKTQHGLSRFQKDNAAD